APCTDYTGIHAFTLTQLIVRSIEKDPSEGDRDQYCSKPVDDQCRGGAAVREDVLVDKRRWEGNDPDGDEQHEIQVEKPTVHPLAVLQQRVVIHPDDADGEEAHKVGGIRRPEAKQGADEISCVRGHAQLEDKERSGDREDAIAEGLEAARSHGPSLNHALCYSAGVSPRAPGQQEPPIAGA